MVESVYKQALTQARKELFELARRQQVIAKQTAKLRQTIATLERLCGETATSSMPLTEAVKSVLMASENNLTAGAIKKALEEIGYDLTKYSNPMAVIHTTLKRAVKKGDIREADDDLPFTTYTVALKDDDIPF